ncbi:acyl carrier protein [Mycoplasmopsis gallopavonis]|nr:acyl carrier protein [Mycoplasmopsis gallopavonis]RIV16821.1 acyl carrier protein [Mycoplasmopsis gallopavonis]
MNIKEKILESFSKQAKRKVFENDFIKDLGIDSLDLMMLVVEAENEFGVQIPDEKLTNITQVKEIILLIEDLKK